MNQYRVVVRHVYYVDAEDHEDAEDRVSDGMGALAGSDYKATRVREEPQSGHRRHSARSARLTPVCMIPACGCTGEAHP